MDRRTSQSLSTSYRG